ncbi:hypothetical protein [Pseudonocardia asaccharolytica]|uniref:SCP2 domain-containing protein n=1 Tax=Pseudonocardia asaccharolytica DSM 44247 = NBRC 16224 TaxID=1123024 RepID=A0A511D0V5_9PSEU|nr:hypothetical protein [Pseudonocardia asaccharolytica]GEL18307.1 hypothetical protein PA7_21440 [Pseudonocardia asaccharolytica DSM 44247 = NBRC 16224]
MTTFDSRWMNSWMDTVNSDLVMPRIGRYFTAGFLLGIGDEEWVVSMQRGQIERITDNLSIETPWSFALRAPRESWEKFVQKIPPPMYNDIWAMAHPLHGRLRMDGDVKVLWQNIRALTWMLACMRQVGDREVVEQRATRV